MYIDNIVAANLATYSYYLLTKLTKSLSHVGRCLVFVLNSCGSSSSNICHSCCDKIGLSQMQRPLHLHVYCVVALWL